MRFIAALLTACCLLSAVNAQAIFRTYAYRPFTTFDPILINDLEHLRIFAQIYEAPLEIAMDGRGQCTTAPALCSLPTISDDGLSLSFRVDAAARFHDDPCFEDGKGRAVTAADIVFSLLRIADPKTQSAYFSSYLEGRIAELDAWRQHAIDNHAADYDRTVAGLKAHGAQLTIQLIEPYPQLIPLLTQPWASVVPREAVRRYGSGFGASHPVGSGPFRFAEVSPLGSIRLTKHAQFRVPGRPLVDEVRFEVIANDEDRSARFDRGDLHVLPVHSANEDKLIDRSGRLKTKLRDAGMSLAHGPMLEVGYLFFNFRHQLLQKPKIREAIALAFDRRAFFAAMFGDIAILADSPVPPAFPEFQSIKLRPFTAGQRDLEKAKSLLSLAGHPEGAGLPELLFDMPNTGIGARERAAADLFVADLAKIGIKVQVRAYPIAEFPGKCQRGDVQIAWVSWYADYPDAENFLGLFRSDPDDPLRRCNFGHYKNVEVDRLYDAICKLYPGPKRTQSIVDLVEQVRTDLPWIPLCYLRRSHILQKGVSGFVYNVLNHNLREVSVPLQKSPR